MWKTDIRDLWGYFYPIKIANILGFPKVAQVVVFGKLPVGKVLANGGCSPEKKSG